MSETMTVTLPAVEEVALINNGPDPVVLSWMTSDSVCLYEVILASGQLWPRLDVIPDRQSGYVPAGTDVVLCQARDTSVEIRSGRPSLRPVKADPWNKTTVTHTTVEAS